MILGPVFHRELAAVPRLSRTYWLRALYPFVFLVLTFTAWVVVAGTQEVRATGDFARFGSLLFQILAPLQLALAVFLAAVSAASTVCQERDRGTLTLLLLTRVNNLELVAGKLAASLLGIVVLLVAAWPMFALALLLGGTSWEQLGRVYAVTVVATLAAGSLGALMGFWREKTFQALALTTLSLVFWFGIWEAVGAGLLGESLAGDACRNWAVRFSPWSALREAMQPLAESNADAWHARPLTHFLGSLSGLLFALTGIACARVRVWCRDGQPRIRVEEAADPRELLTQAGTRRMAPNAAREVWDNPVLWREIRTWAYGRRVLVVRVAYVVLFALAAAGLYALGMDPRGLTRMAVASVLVPLGLLCLVLINAQAVTALTTERDGRSLDLLLVTDLTPREFLFGKLVGILYNTKEMLILPALLFAVLWFGHAMTLENTLYLLGGAGVLMAFVAMLGVHCGLIYGDSRQAIAVSLGTVFFLFLGVATCMRMMVAFSGSFQVQLAPFLGVMFGGGVGLFVALGAKNPSPALGLASMLCPFSTFYAITGFLLDNTLGVFIVVVAMYGFATVAMLVPALYEFDVAIGRTTPGND